MFFFCIERIFLYMKKLENFFTLIANGDFFQSVNVIPLVIAIPLEFTLISFTNITSFSFLCFYTYTPT